MADATTKAVTVSEEVHRRLREVYAATGIPIGHQAETLLRTGLGLPVPKKTRPA